MRCYHPVLIQSTLEVKGEYQITEETWLGCKLERGHDGPHEARP